MRTRAIPYGACSAKKKSRMPPKNDERFVCIEFIVMTPLILGNVAPIVAFFKGTHCLHVVN